MFDRRGPTDAPFLFSLSALQVAQALLANTHVKRVQMVNAKVNTAAAEAFAALIRANTPLEVLNLESNDITSPGIKAIAEALHGNTTLAELKLTNQKQLVGTDAERTLAVALEQNTTLAKFSLPIRDPGSRVAIDRFMTRNAELARQRRRAAAAGK